MATSASLDRAQPMPGARMALTMLVVINLFNYIDRQVLAAVVPELKHEYFPDDVGADGQSAGDSKEMLLKLGSLQTAFMVSYMLTAPLFGWLAEKFPRWKIIGLGVILWTLASGASGFAHTFFIMFLTRCFVGLGEAAYGPAAPTLISDLYPLSMRGKVISWFYVAIPVGSALGYVLGGLMLKLTGHWSWSFFAVVPPGLVLGAICFFMPEPKRGQADAGAVASTGPKWRDLKILYSTPSYVLDTLGMTAMTFAMGGIAFWMPYYIVHDKGYGDPTSVNLTFGAIVVIAGLGATLLGGMLGDYLREKIRGAYFLVSACAMFLGFLCVPLILYLPFPLAWVFVFLSCFCLFFNTGPTNTVLANVTHPSLRATAFALNILVIHALGDAVSPMIIGTISDRTSMTTGFMCVSVLILVGGAFWLWGTRYLDRDTELAPTRISG